MITKDETLAMLDALNEEMSKMTDEQLGDFLMNHSETFRREVENEILAHLVSMVEDQLKECPHNVDFISEKLNNTLPVKPERCSSEEIALAA